MPTGTWVITTVRGGNGGLVLRNCVIVGTSFGYEIYSPAPTRALLAENSSLSAPITFTFRYFNSDWSWRVTIDNLNPRPSGRWSINEPNPEAEIGTWDSGVGGEEGEEEEAVEEDAEGDYSAT